MPPLNWWDRALEVLWAVFAQQEWIVFTVSAWRTYALHLRSSVPQSHRVSSASSCHMHPLYMFTNCPIQHSSPIVAALGVTIKPSTFFSNASYSSPGSTCSGNGACRYSDPSGNLLHNCTILDVRCTASCSCEPQFGGNDCSLSISGLTARDSLR